MVIKVIAGLETIFMDKVEFINENENSVTVTTEDGKETEIASAEGIVSVVVWDDNGVQIEPTQTKQEK